MGCGMSSEGGSVHASSYSSYDRSYERSRHRPQSRYQQPYSQASVQPAPQYQQAVTSAGMYYNGPKRGGGAGAVPSSTTSGASKGVTWAEVARHNTATDCWVVVDGRVYDVTRFLSTHPGGSGLLLSYAGKDCTRPFKTTHSHVNHASMLSSYYKGTVQ